MDYRAAPELISRDPVPLYQDAVAEEMEYILTHCNATFAIVGDQEQVDKIYEISGSLKGFKDIVYVDPKGLRKYDKTKLHDLDSVIKRGENAKRRTYCKLPYKVRLRLRHTLAKETTSC